MSISRSSGYRRSQGKEGPGLDALEEFMLATVGVALRRVYDADENYNLGDFIALSGATIECKRQPIDPGRYPQNFVEVCEATQNPRHLGGYTELATILDVEARPRVDLVWSPPRSSSTYRLADEPRLSISIHTFVRAALVGYVNPGQHIYIYPSDKLLAEIRRAALERPLVRGAGNSNADTFAAYVPLADWRWSKHGTTWAYMGRGREDDAIDAIKTELEMT